MDKEISPLVLETKQSIWSRFKNIIPKGYRLTDAITILMDMAVKDPKIQEKMLKELKTFERVKK